MLKDRTSRTREEQKTASFCTQLSEHKIRTQKNVPKVSYLVLLLIHLCVSVGYSISVSVCCVSVCMCVCAVFDN